MKTIKLILGIGLALVIFNSCTPKEINDEPQSTEIAATGDDGDDIGEDSDGDD